MIHTNAPNCFRLSRTLALIKGSFYRLHKNCAFLPIARKHETIYKLSAYDRFCLGKSYFSWPNTRCWRETLDFHVEYRGSLDGNKLRKSSHILAPGFIWKVFQSCLTSQRLTLHFTMFCLQTFYWKLGRENIIHDSIRTTEFSRQIVEERRPEQGYT